MRKDKNTHIELTYVVDDHTKLVLDLSAVLQRLDYILLTPYHDGVPGRPCQKQVHSFYQDQFFWWNNQKISIVDFAYLSTDEFFEKLDKCTITRSEAYSTLLKNPEIGIVFNYPSHKVIAYADSGEFLSEAFSFMTLGDLPIRAARLDPMGLSLYKISPSHNDVLDTWGIISPNINFVKMEVGDDGTTVKTAHSYSCIQVNLNKKVVRSVSKLTRFQRLVTKFIY